MNAGLAHFLFMLGQEHLDWDLYVNSGVRGIPNARNRAARSFLGSSHDRLFFLDSDVLPQPNALELLEVDGDIVSGTYKQSMQGFDDPKPVVQYIGRDLERKLFDFDLRRVEEAAFVPFGCTIFSRKVLEDERLWVTSEPIAMFDSVWTTDGREISSEDVSFCRRARGLGYDIRMHTGIRFGHVKTVDLEHFT
jgi:GT2 family glycosyltransferase